VKLPLINQIRTDFGYLVFGVFLCLFGWQATVVGVLGCIISNLLYSGTFPLGWALGQLFIGLFCGWLLPKQNSRLLRCLTAAFAVLVGIAGIKTVVESVLFDLPLALKAVRGLVAAVADLIPFLVGILISDRLPVPRETDRKE
jgi:Mn2+/Fe2+ NRAMP family transporter